jgi:hypothetical protein
MQDQIFKIFDPGSSIRQASARSDARPQAFRPSCTTIAGIELMHRIRKGHFKLGRLGTKGNMAPMIWNAVLAA